MEIHCIVYSLVVFDFFVGGFVEPFVGKTLTEYAQTTITIRLELWRTSILEFLAYPLFGAGFECMKYLIV